MKYGNNLKIIAFCDQTIAIVAIKKKGGLLFTAADTGFIGKGTCFTCDIGGTLTSVRFFKVGKRFKVKIDLPRRGQAVVMFCKTKKKFKDFLQTDYAGFKL